jgi:large subunit ribosomal protein L6
MSRIGKAPITVPPGVEVNIANGMVTISGKLGTLTQAIVGGITVSQEENVILVNRPSDSRTDRAMHGLTRALLANMVIGVTEGYTKTLELIGVGFRASNQGQVLDLSLGYSHNIMVRVPEDCKVITEMVKGKAPKIILTSHDKHLVGMVASKIRSFRKPEPYKGKGVRYMGEIVRKKAGKSASGKA